MSDAPSPFLHLTAAHLISVAFLPLNLDPRCLVQIHRLGEEREVERIKCMMLQCSNVPQVAAAERERERGREGRSCSLYQGRRIDYGRDGGMYSRRKGKGWAPGSASAREKSLGSAN